jgi:hypothetical protein
VRTALARLILLVVLLCPSVALADDSPRPNAISYEPFAITSRGMLLQYERLVLPKLSLVGGVGARFAARDDFSSWTLVLKSEARWWLTAREALSDTRGMVGPYLALALAGSRTELEHRATDRVLGAMWDVEESLRFGYRFVIFGFQEITPSVGFGMVHEIDENGRLAASTRPSYFGLNLTVGWMF